MVPPQRPSVPRANGSKGPTLGSHGNPPWGPMGTHPSSPRGWAFYNSAFSAKQRFLVLLAKSVRCIAVFVFPAVQHWVFCSATFVSGRNYVVNLSIFVFPAVQHCVSCSATFGFLHCNFGVVALQFVVQFLCRAPDFS